MECFNKLVGSIHVALLRFLFAQYSLGVFSLLMTNDAVDVTLRYNLKKN